MTKAEWILGGMLTLLLLVVAGLAVALWRRPDVSTTPPQLDGGLAAVSSEQTALSALAVAQREANLWQADAQLVKGTATWPQGTPAFEAGKAAWSFTFYSAKENRTAIFTVTDYEASFLNERPLTEALLPANVTGWKVDSQKAIELMLAEGGRSFLEQAGAATMLMNLTTVNENGRVEWFISLINEQTGQSFSVRLDATSGEVLEKLDAA
jgi:hypothetical protein